MIQLSAMTATRFGLSRWERLTARTRMPVTATAIAVLALGLFAPVPQWWPWVTIATAIPATALYFRLGTPHGDSVDISAPVLGRWRVVNSPTSRVPSHFVHAWSQTYAIDLVFDPADGSRPQMSWRPLARRPYAYPGFGQDIVAPIDGDVVRARSFMRDHLSRSSPPGLIYLILESVREFFGPTGVLGNHIVIRRHDGVHVLMAHLRQGSLLVERGDSVTRGSKIAECGNSGNSTEPHVHVQAMDRASVWFAAGLPTRFDHVELPPNGGLLLSGRSA